MKDVAFVTVENVVDALVVCTVYFTLAPLTKTAKQRGWLLTSFSSCAMTLSSIPFAYPFLASGLDVKSVPLYPEFAYHVVRLFQSYLVVDLVLGAIYYPKYVNLVSGWIHHFVYIVLLHFVLVYDWSHVFCMALMMELPTFLLAIASIFPALRNDVLFATAFFVTRIALHAFYIVAYSSPHGRESVNGNWAPAVLFITAFPLHASWFYGCIKGFIRRHKQAQEAKAKHAKIIEVSPPDTPLQTPRGEAVGSTKDISQSALAKSELLSDSGSFTLVSPPTEEIRYTRVGA